MRHLSAIAALLAPALAAASPAAAAPTETVLHSNDTGTLAGQVVRASDGTLYGAKFLGPGYIYSLTPPDAKGKAWSYQNIYSFANATDGTAGPYSLILDKSGVIYGLAVAGGTNNVGAVFELTPPSAGGKTWTETVLYNLAPQDGNPDSQPISLILAANGALYGTTQGNFPGAGPCSGSCGTAFELLPPKDGGTAWRYKTLYVFQGGADGFNPAPALARDAQGDLFGVTESGGIDGCYNFDVGCGTVFELTPPAKGQTAWTKTTLYSFTGGTDGGLPIASLVIGKDGTLYGSAEDGGIVDACTINARGCGVAFELTPPAPGSTSWTETVLHAFQCTPDGAYPNDGFTLGADGSLTGTVLLCGTPPEGGADGAIIRLFPPKNGGNAWTSQAIFTFANSGGYQPNSKLVRDKLGNFYGTTAYGGAENHGAVFEVTK